MRIRNTIYFLFFYIFPIGDAAALNSQSTIIPPVVVKAKQPLNRSLTSGPQSTITQQQLSTTGTTTLAQALQHLGGVQLQNLSGNNSQVPLGLRGFGANASSNTLMLINGIPLTNPDLAPPDLNAIPLNDIQYIEVIAGSESVLYGDQAVGGIINIVTKREAQEKLLLSCEVGSYNQHNCYATLNNNYNLLNYSLTAENNHTDNYRDHNDYDQNLVLGRFDYAYQTGRIHFNYKLANEDMQYPGALTALQVRQNRRQASNDTDFFTDWSGFFHIKHQQQLPSNWQIETDLSRREMHGHGVLSVPFNQSRMIYYLKPQLKGKINQVQLTSGIDLQSDRYHLGSNAFSPTNNDEQKYGVFGIANIPVYSKFSLSLGARGAQQHSHLESFVDNDTINRALATTLGMTYQADPYSHFYIRRAGSFRFPKADENAAVASGVTALRTQRGIAYESGIQTERDDYSAKAGIYQLNLRDEIAFDPTQTPQAPFGSNVNLAPTKRYGFTLSGKTNITAKLALDGQYNYVNARFQHGMNAGNRIPLVSENIFRSGINYHFAQYWYAYAEALYTGNQFSANDYANVSGKMGGYTIYNFNLLFMYEHLSASFRINNIFNKDYYFYTVYQPSTQSESFYPAPERNITLTVKYVFM